MRKINAEEHVEETSAPEQQGRGDTDAEQKSSSEPKRECRGEPDEEQAATSSSSTDVRRGAVRTDPIPGTTSSHSDSQSQGYPGPPGVDQGESTEVPEDFDSNKQRQDRAEEECNDVDQPTRVARPKAKAFPQTSDESPVDVIRSSASPSSDE